MPRVFVLIEETSEYLTDVEVTDEEFRILDDEVEHRNYPEIFERVESAALDNVDWNSPTVTDRTVYIRTTKD